MTRRILCITERAADANAHVRLQVGMLLMIGMYRRGFAVSAYLGHENTMMHVDYALEAPEWLPAGACRQAEDFDDGDEDDWPQQTFSADQITIRREELE